MLDWASANNVVVMAHGVHTAAQKDAAAGLGATVIRGRVVGPVGPLP